MFQVKVLPKIQVKVLPKKVLPKLQVKVSLGPGEGFTKDSGGGSIKGSDEGSGEGSDEGSDEGFGGSFQ